MPTIRCCCCRFLRPASRGHGDGGQNPRSRRDSQVGALPLPADALYKVLRVLEHFNDHEGQLYEVCTMDRGSNAWWTGKKPVPRTVCLGLWLTVVINGIVYFFYYMILHRAEQDYGGCSCVPQVNIKVIPTTSRRPSALQRLNSATSSSPD
jgi:hypothetical protein